MKRAFFLFLLLLSIVAMPLAAGEVESLIDKGIAAHDRGDYQEAVNFYKKALEIDPSNGLAHYEMAYSLYSAGELDLAIEHCKKSLEYSSDDEKLPAYDVYASILDDKGEPEKACEIYEEAISKYPYYFLIRYNYGLTLTRLNRLDEAEIMFRAAIMLEPRHPTSHVTLAANYYVMERNVEATLASYFFLLLEPNSARTPIFYKSFEDLLGYNSGKKKINEDGNEVVPITFNPSAKVDPRLKHQGLMLSMSKALNSSKKDSLNNLEFLKLVNDNFFDMIVKESIFDFRTEEDENSEDRDDFWTYYVKVLLKIKEKDYVMPMLCYISRSKNYPEAIEWMQENEDTMKEFEQWLYEEIFSDRELFLPED
jgi:tetratricopeptide (TPR) repeat protein